MLWCCSDGELLPVFSVELEVPEGIRVNLQLLNACLEPVEASCHTADGTQCGQLVLQQVSWWWGSQSR